MDLRPRRSVLYLPASNPKALAKARTLATDVLVLDLEDAVAPESKVEARAAAVAAIAEGGFGWREVVIRVNAFGTAWAEDDLAAVAKAGPDAVLVPKVSNADDVRAYDAAIADAPARTRLWIMVETCALIPRLGEVAALASSTRLAAFAMGTNDLAKEMRASFGPVARRSCRSSAPRSARRGRTACWCSTGSATNSRTWTWSAPNANRGSNSGLTASV